MSEMMEEVYKAALHAIETRTPEDEVLIITFNVDVELVQDFTSDRRKLLRAIRDLRAGGSTALYDAIALALDHIKQGKHQKKVLVVVTDGEDNASRMSFTELLDMVKEGEALIYTIGFFHSMDGGFFGFLRGSSRNELKRLSEETGAIAYFPENMEECEQACRDIAVQVSRQYSLGYYPSNTNWDGRWRKIKVALRDSEKFVVRARKGYFAPKAQIK